MSYAGWPTAPFGDLVLDLQPGFASGKHNSDGVGIPHLRPMNVSTAGAIERSAMKFVDPSAGRASVRLSRGDILFNNTNSPELVGKTAYFDDDDEPAYSNHMTRVRVDPRRLDARYAALRLHHAWREGWFADHCNNHVSQASVGRDVLQSFPIEVPPLEIQRSIAALDRAVGLKSSSAQVHLSAAREAITRFRQAALAAACSGRLTHDWREANPSVEDGHALLARVEAARRDRLGRRYTQPAPPVADEPLPAGWVWTTIGALVDVATGATPRRNRVDYYGGPHPWVTSGAVNSGVIVGASEYLTDLALKETNTKLFPAGTLLVAMYGEGQTRGRVAELGISAATNQALAALLFDEASEHLRPYLRLFLLENYERIRQRSFGGVQPNLSLGVIRETPVPLPSVEEQLEIVRKTDELLARGDELLQRLSTSGHHIERSSRAVLAKAFRGELVGA